MTSGIRIDPGNGMLTITLVRPATARASAFQRRDLNQSTAAR